MAKRKTKKSKEVIDLKPKAEFITADELTSIREVVSRLDGLQMHLGKIEVQKHQVLHQVAGLNDEVKVQQAKLEDKYGKIDIDLKDGAIKHPEDGEVNS
tara:strand:- start:9 stop:305 length:297 start_codon:yes stop_codon:yes gene_type:complete